MPKSRSKRPIPPGVSIMARRPGVFFTLPIYGPLWFLLFAGTTIVWVGVSRTLVLADGVKIMALPLSLFAVAMGWERQRKVAEYEALLEKVGSLVAAWEDLKRASGLGWGLEHNIIIATSQDNVRTLGRRRQRKLKVIEKDVRNVKAVNRPASLEEINKTNRGRYKIILALNHRVLSVLFRKPEEGDRETSLFKKTGNPPFPMPFVDTEALTRLDKASSEWDKAVAEVRSAVTRWDVLEQLITRSDTLVRYWWTFVRNDPYYRNFTSDYADRCKAFDDAKQAVELLDDGVRHKDLGHPLWRALLIRVFFGARASVSVDAERNMVK